MILSSNVVGLNCIFRKNISRSDKVDIGDGVSAFLGGEPLSKEKTLAYKSHLMDCGKFADSSINSMIASIRALLKRCQQGDHRGIKALNKNL